MGFTDIREWDWIKPLPAFVKPYVFLMRLDRPIGWWLLLLPAWWAIALATEEFSSHTISLLVLFFFGAIIMRGAGCVINDLWDRNLDKKVERTAVRPIASGQIDLEDAFIFLGLLLILGLAILILMPLTTILLGILTLPLIVAYPLMKRITWWPQAFLGITFNFGALMGWSAVTGELGWAPLLLYIAGIFWTLGYDTIYAHQDIEDDMKVGIKSTALKFGEASQTWVIGFYGAALLFFFMALIASGAAWFTYILCMFGFGFAASRIYQWQPEDQKSSLETFKSNQYTGLLLFVACSLQMLLS